MSSNKTILKNSAFLYLRLLITIAIGLFSTRVVLQAMGVEDFGIYGVVAGLVSMFTFLNSAMSSSTQRYLAFDLGKKDYTQLQKTFTTVLNIHLAIAIISMVIAEVVGQWAIRSFLTIPEERLAAAIHAYHYVVILFGFGIIQVPFHAAIIANEKMEAFAYISILESVLKLAAAYLLFTATTDLLVLYSQLLALTALIIFLLYFIYSKTKFPETKYLRYFDKDYYKEILSFSGWNLFGHAAAIFRSQGGNILINIFFGTVANAAYYLSMMVIGLVSTFLMSLQQAVNPQIIKRFGEKDKDSSIYLALLTSRATYFITLAMMFVFYRYHQEIFTLWLNEYPEELNILLISMIPFLLLESLSYSLIVLVQANGKIKSYQIGVSALIFLVLPISWTAYKLNYPLEFFYIVTSFITFVVLVFRIYFLQKLAICRAVRFIKEVLLKALGPLICLCLYSSFIEKFETIEFIFLDIVMAGLVWVLSIYFLGISSFERKYINSFVGSGGK